MRNVRYCNNGEAGLRIIAESPNKNDFFPRCHPLAVCRVPLFFCGSASVYWRDVDEDIFYFDTLYKHPICDALQGLAAKTTNN